MIVHKPDKGITGTSVMILSEEHTNFVRQMVGSILLSLGMKIGKMFVEISGLDFGLDFQKMTEDKINWGIVCDGEQVTVTFEEDSVTFPLAAVKSAIIWLLNKYHIKTGNTTHSGDEPV